MDNKIITLLISGKDEDYGTLVKTVEEKGKEILALLMESFPQIGDTVAKVRLIRLITAIEDPKVVPFLEKSLEDDDFEVRNASALSLKLLTDRDYYEKIYKSDIGLNLKRNFWCDLDFTRDENHREKNRAILSSTVDFFNHLATQWTYSWAEEGFTIKKERKHPPISSDGEVLFNDTLYGMEKVLKSGVNINHIIKHLIELFSSKEGEEEELKDIFRCLKQGLGSNLKRMEEGLSLFISAFPYLRTEYNLCLTLKEEQPIVPFSDSLSPDEKEKEKILTEGMKRFSLPSAKEEKPADNPMQEENPVHEEAGVMQCSCNYLLLLSLRIRDLESLWEEFFMEKVITPQGYFLLKRIGLCTIEMMRYTLLLLSSWWRDQ